jgi:hypothetical protein
MGEGESTRNVAESVADYFLTLFPFRFNMAERAGFEPSIQALSPYNGLAIVHPDVTPEESQSLPHVAANEASPNVTSFVSFGRQSGHQPCEGNSPRRLPSLKCISERCSHRFHISHRECMGGSTTDRRGCRGTPGVFCQPVYIELGPFPGSGRGLGCGHWWDGRCHRWNADCENRGLHPSVDRQLSDSFPHGRLRLPAGTSSHPSIDAAP